MLLRLIAYNTYRITKLEYVILIWFLQGRITDEIVPYPKKMARYRRNLLTRYDATMSAIGIKQKIVYHIILTGPLAGMNF